MDLGNDTKVELQLYPTDNEPINVPLTVFRLIVCVFGILGNLLVIFLILILAEYKKAVTHWYVLQLAIADSIFLLTIPFRIVEDIENGWNFSTWMCKAKETILFLNYYSSISFLVVMSIDRYIAVCHGFSSRLQKLRTPLAAGIITVAIWIICLLICIPIMIYSTPRGHKPHCRCEYQFPKPLNLTEICLQEGETEGTNAFDACVEQLEKFPEGSCTDLTSAQLGSGGSGFGLTFDIDSVDNVDDFLWGDETTASPDEDNITSTPPVVLHPGCHYFEFADGFKVFILFNFIAMFLIPLIIMSVCYALIVHRLYRSRFHVETIRRQDSYSESKSRPASLSSTGRKRTKSTSSTKNKNRVRVTIMCAAMVTLFFVCWLPFHSVHIARFVGIQQSSQYCFTLYSVAALIAFTNSAINPYVYNFVGTRFWKRLKRVRKSKTAKAFLSFASGVAKVAGHHSSTSGAENDHGSASKGKRKEISTKGVKTKEKNFATQDDMKSEEARAELLKQYPVYTGPTSAAQPPPSFESLSKSELPLYPEPSSIITRNEGLKMQALTVKREL